MCCNSYPGLGNRVEAHDNESCTPQAVSLHESLQTSIYEASVAEPGGAEFFHLTRDSEERSLGLAGPAPKIAAAWPGSAKVACVSDVPAAKRASVQAASATLLDPAPSRAFSAQMQLYGATKGWSRSPPARCPGKCSTWAVVCV